MPEDHQKYLEWNGDRFHKWASRIGHNTYQVVDSILISNRVEQQNYRSCMGILKLADKYSIERLEAACSKALSYNATPSYKSIKNILLTEHDKLQTAPDRQETTHNNYGIVRGTSYYGR